MEKVLPPLYQHPYVDVFHKFKLFDDSQITKEGDVTSTIDKKLGKKIYKIQGSTSASNYVMTPCKNAKYKSLGLTGKFNYIIMKTQVAKLFSTHLDFIVNEKHHVRVSISNIFKETKVTGGSIKIPIPEIEAGKWTIVQLNIYNILEENNMFSKSHGDNKFYLRSFQICSNQFIRDIVTSDIEYNVGTFPKDLALKSKGDWFTEYGWITIGKGEDIEEPTQDVPKKSAKPQRPKSALRHTMGQPTEKDQESKSKKRVAFTLDKNEIKKDIHPVENQENIKDLANLQEKRKSIKEMHLEREEEDKKAIHDELYRVRDSSTLIERTKREIEDIKRQYEIELYGKASDDFSVRNNEKLLMQRQPIPEGSDDPNDVFLLRPDPIMRLNQCIGSHPKFNSRSILFHRNPKYGSDVIYGSANMIISMNTKTMKQRFLFDHQDHV